jgi:hypothetical protein
VYDLLADYRVGHPSILPRKYFTRLEVEQGGAGAGTVIRVTMRVLGSSHTFRAAVTEPEPGRVLVETDLATGLVTTFTVEPKGPAECELTFTTTLPQRPGVQGVVERFVSRRLLPKVYREELALVAKAVEG